ncbi:hypothetical protein CI109_100811 [Kwoniella shandongensis]|uniref:Uncharacterized protein n=1 Tax=Kwoniella shandongensis TaxID=1734106 RepID=A0A5M6BPS2_9TREE|nr:uncharacterized protein CI109_006901 [Kwoniella shandongensis]KAA5524747.1 hypothetical protein CI109_006901 [Kwoniella shandongensis]
MTSSVAYPNSHGATAGNVDAIAPTPPILTLPPELIDHLLSLVPPQSLQRTTLALLRVFPQHPFASKHLWTHLVVYRKEQLIPLWRKLKEDEGMRDGVASFTLQSWRADADILNNVMRCLNHINTLMLNIGTNFAPDHLEEMFMDPREDMERMELRFRPYVEQASYYQFLAGSYFDTAIESIYRNWPSTPSFTHLSIVQDLPPRTTAPPTAPSSTAASLSNSFADLSVANTDVATSDSDEQSGRSTPPTSISSSSEGHPLDNSKKHYTGHGPFGNPYLNEKMGITKPKTFAQPIVFFDIQCLAKFGASPVAEHLTHLRMRVPSRDLARVLISTPRIGDVLFPSLRYLDISTTNVRIDTTLSTLLRTYTRLEHLVLDRVNLFGFSAREKGPELCHDLGGLLVSAGLAKGKERERQIAAWELQERTRLAEAEAARRRAQSHAARQNGGGEEEQQQDVESAAEIAERERREELQRNIELARSRRGHRSAAQANFSLRDRPARRFGAGATAANASALAGMNVPSVFVPPPDKLYLVLPPLPTLKSISIGGEAHTLSSTKVAEWEEEFHAGWREGLGKVLGWATHIADKYERARRKADEWRVQEMKNGGNATASGSGSGGGGNHHAKHSTGGAGSKGKAKSSSSATSSTSAGLAGKARPPTDIRLYRFPRPDEQLPIDDRPGPYNLTAGLIEIDLDLDDNRTYLDPYRQAIGDAQLFADQERGVKAPCVFCTVPDCEGPQRKGAEGEKVDGRGGMGGIHRAGCGHLLGRKIWGWDGF